MGGKSSQNKGKRGEREVIGLLQPVVTQVYAQFGYEGDDIPQLQRNTLQSDRGGCDVHGLDWMALEIKRDESMSLSAMWAQAVRQAGMKKHPILFYRRNNMPWKVRTIGLLGTNSAGVTVAVDVSVEDFLKWFRVKLVWELT